MALSHMERGQTAVEAVLAAIFNELAASPEAVPQYLRDRLTVVVEHLCAALAHPSRGSMACPRCGTWNLGLLTVVDEISRVWRALRCDGDTLTVSDDVVVPEACTPIRLRCVPCTFEYEIPADIAVCFRPAPPTVVAGIPGRRTP